MTNVKLNEMTSLFNLQVDAPSLRQFDNGKVFLPADDVKLKDMTTVEMVDMFWKYSYFLVSSIKS
jgi:hypothetical protein